MECQSSSDYFVFVVVGVEGGCQRQRLRRAVIQRSLPTVRQRQFDCFFQWSFWSFRRVVCQQGGQGLLGGLLESLVRSDYRRATRSQSFLRSYLMALLSYSIPTKAYFKALSDSTSRALSLFTFPTSQARPSNALPCLSTSLPNSPILSSYFFCLLICSFTKNLSQDFFCCSDSNCDLSYSISELSFCQSVLQLCCNSLRSELVRESQSEAYWVLYICCCRLEVYQESSLVRVWIWRWSSLLFYQSQLEWDFNQLRFCVKLVISFLSLLISLSNLIL